MLIILIIIPFFSCVFSQDFIREPNIIQLREYTNLICVLNSTNYLDIFKKYSFLWLKLNENENYDFIIDLKNNTIINNNYFKNITTFIINNKFILQIKNMNEDYKKYKFECAYSDNEKLKRYKNRFTNLTDLTFVNPLSSKNMKIEYFSNTININFNKTFSIPKCFIKINNKYIYFKNIKSTKINYLYFQVKLSIKIEKINCLEKIICNLLNQNFIIYSSNNICIVEDSIYSIYSIISVSIILFLISGIILAIFIYFKIKDPSERKEILYSLINKIKK